MDKQKIIEQLINIGHSLTSEKNYDKLMEGILSGAKDITESDGGTLYIKTEDARYLQFKFVQTDSLFLKMGGTNGAIHWTPLDLIREDGTQNRAQVASVCALDAKLINIPDVYEVKEYNFEGTKAFDSGTGYRSKSMLVVPMTNYDNEVMGVLQLINKKDKNNNTISFTKDDEKLILSMSSQAAVSIANIRLINNLEILLNSFIKTIGTAISEKSNYTGGHINRVATLSTLLSEAINEDTTIFKDISFTKNELVEINTSAWLHDIGKIVTPEYIVDKATKLETIYDRINAIKLKFELLKKDKEIEYLKAVANEKDIQKCKQLKNQYDKFIQHINNDFLFIEHCNTGGEFMADDKIKRVQTIASNKVKVNNKEEDLLNEDEIYNLSIKKGTLTQEEREIINNHVTVTYNMLKKLPFPNKLKNVPLIAGSHHKAVRTNNNDEHGGYGASEIMQLPMGIKEKILAVADVFEALTASDRPYKKANSLNQAVQILYFMAKDNDLDRDLVKFFIGSGLYLEYAQEYLDPSQLDEVNVDFDDMKVEFVQRVLYEKVRILGASGGRQRGEDLISIELDKGIILDAGNIMNAKNLNIYDIEHIFITHTHLDHIVDIGLLIDSTFAKRTEPLKIYGSIKTLEDIKKYILNTDVWPDFTQINLINTNLKAIELIPLEIGHSIDINNVNIKAIPNNHTQGSNGYTVTKKHKAICFTSDTYICPEIWEEINNNNKISTVIIEVSFPSHMEQLAKSSKHLTPLLLKEELRNLKRKDVTIYINHLKPSFKEAIIRELSQMQDMLNGGRVLNSNDIVKF